MIVLDTNVISELMKAAPAEPVARWVADQSTLALFTTSIAQAEIFYGIMLLPAGRRRESLEAAAEAMFEEDFSGRVLPFGGKAAQAYASIATQRRRAGRPISHFDAQIAAIARSVHAPIATRNVSDYQGCGVKVLNPWED